MIRVKSSAVLFLRKTSELYLKEFSVRFIFNLALIIIIWSFRFPHVFRKLYAEDGATLLQGTFYDKSFLGLFDPVGGFLQLIGRLGGHFIRIFPLERAPLAAALFTAICIALLASLIFHFSENKLKSDFHQFLLSIFFLFIPIANFNSTGTVCNLYMYFMAASGILLYTPENEKKFQYARNTVIFIAVLSNPLCIFLIPLILGRIIFFQAGKLKPYFNSGDYTFFAGLLIQFGFILFSGVGDRAPHAPNSLFSVIYLYLDRGIGSTFFPNWGFVSGNASNPQFENTYFLRSLYLRFFISSLVLIAVLLLSMISLKHKKTKSGIDALTLLITSLIFTFLIGLFYSVEPRYMIFSSVMSFYALLTLLSDYKSKFKVTLTSIWFFLLILMSLTPSSYVSQGPNWSTNLQREKWACLAEPSKAIMEIRIMPLSDWWSVKVPCPNK